MHKAPFALIRILMILAALLICVPAFAQGSNTAELTMLQILGNQSPSLGVPQVYTVRVKNTGSRDCDAFWVQLSFWQGAPISSSRQYSLAAGAILDIPFSCVFTSSSPYKIQAELFVRDSGFGIQNAYQYLDLRLHDEPNISYTSYLDAKSRSNTVYDLSKKSSLYQCIYYPDDIGREGKITKLNIYFLFRTISYFNAPLQIWLGHTDKMDLTDGFEDASEMTLVYDDSPMFIRNYGVIRLTLQTPFHYQGGNLALMILRPFTNATYLENNEFFGAILPGYRSRSVSSNSSNINIHNPPASVASSFVLGMEFGFAPDAQTPHTQIFQWQQDLCIFPMGSQIARHLSVFNRGPQGVYIHQLRLLGQAAFELDAMPDLPLRLDPGQSVQCAVILKADAPGLKSSEFQVIGAGGQLLCAKTLQFETQSPGFDLPLYEDFSCPGIAAIPLGWDMLNLGNNPNSSIYHSPSFGHQSAGHISMQNSTDFPGSLWLIAPALNLHPWQNSLIVKFWAKSNTPAQLILGLMDESLSASGFETISSFDLSQQWNLFYLCLPVPPAGRRISFKHGGNGININISLDEVAIERLAGHDLALLELNGGTQLFRGVLASHTIKIKNWGSNVENDYQICLEDESGMILWQGTSEAVLPLETKTMEASWIPYTGGETRIFAKVSMRQDENAHNDSSLPLKLMVYEPDEGYLELGRDQRRELMPLDFNAKASLYQVIIPHEQMQHFYGWISSLTLWGHFSSFISNKPVRIWMGSTNQQNLAEDWIPCNELELVYSGMLSVQPGSQLIHFPFTAGFDYRDGKNLVILFSRDWNIASFDTGNRFQNWTIPLGNARGASSATGEINPEYPPLGAILDFCPRLGFELSYGGIGNVDGIVLDTNGQALADATLELYGGEYQTQSLPDGSFGFKNIRAGMAQLGISKHGYRPQIMDIEIPDMGLLCIQPRLSSYPSLCISGNIVASDTQLPLSGAQVSVRGYTQAETTSLSDGSFFLPNLWGEHQYQFEIRKDGYSTLRGTWDLQDHNLQLGTLVLDELAWQPQCVLAIEEQDIVQLHWLAPSPGSWNLSEDFEAESFPPQGWQQIITNDSPAGNSGVLPTWCSFGAVYIDGQIVQPPSGEKQAGLWWSYEHQDEWLISPQFNCPYQAHLVFETCCRYGHEAFGSYSVKLSADQGMSWITLWEAANQPSGWNIYQTPVQIDLANWGGMQIPLAWHAQDSAEQSGLWYLWLIDAIKIHNNQISVKLSFDKKQPNKAERGLTGYRISRGHKALEQAPETWTPLQEVDISQLVFADQDWASLGNGWYRWKVEAVYANGVVSAPAYSNTLHKHVAQGSLAGIVRSASQSPIAAATITAGTYQTTTNAAGAYNLILPVGTHNVRASAPGYVSQTVSDVVVIMNQTSTLNFVLEPGSAIEDEHLPVTATGLGANYPNPFNPSTSFSYSIREPGLVKLEVFNIKGQLVCTLVNADQASGHYKTTWNGKDASDKACASGVYFYRLSAPGFRQARKMVMKR